MFNDWSLSRGFRPRPVKDDVPPAMREDLTKVAAQIWSHGRDQGRNMKLNEHDELVETYDALKLAYVAATARVKALEERLGIEDKFDANDEETDAAAGRRKEAIAFWDGLLRKVAKRMGNQRLNPDLAYMLLDPEENREAEPWAKPKKWSSAVLGGKMKGRAGEGKIFELVGEDLYRALGQEGDAAPAEPTPGANASAEPVPQHQPETTSGPASRPGRMSWKRRTMPEAASKAATPLAAVPAVRLGLRALARVPADMDDDDGAPDDARFDVAGRPSG